MSSKFKPMNKIINLCLFLLFTNALTAQSFYERYGAETESYILNMHLINTLDQLSAILYSVDKQSNSILRYDLTGQLTKDGACALKTYDDSDITFTGLLEGHELKLESKNFGNNAAIRFYPAYPEGSVKMSYTHKKSTAKLNDENIFSPSAGTETALLLPENNRTLSSLLLGFYRIDNSDDLSPEELINQEHSKFFEQYRRLNADLEGHSASLNWERSQHLQVLMNDAGILCIEKASYAFTGGAHGLTNVQYIIADIQRGAHLSTEDIFKEGYERELAPVLTAKVRARYAIPSEQSLTEAGLFIDYVEPNQNIYVTFQGIGFYFNNYDIAPYAMGHTDIFFQFKEIKHLIKPDSIVNVLLAE